ncbi:MAG: alpha/beta fold hydrolase [Myxococcota bacterium]
MSYVRPVRGAVWRTVVATAAAATVVATISCGGTGTEGPGFDAPPSSGAGGSSSGASPSVTSATSVAAASGAGGSSGGGGGAAALGPPYPIVLAHGFFGFEAFAGLDFATYFYGVREHLADHGEVQVYTPAVDPFNDSTHRGAQLRAAIEHVVATTGHAKVNIIGHSQGGLDARVVAHDRPDLVASVISLQTPHGGAPLADVALGLTQNPALGDALDWIAQTFGAGLYDAIDGDTSISAALGQFSTPAIADFDARYPDDPSVFYASIAGRSDWSLGGPACNVSGAPPFISAWIGERDPIDPLFSFTEALTDGGFGDPYPNDGLVRVVDARHGLFLGCLPADHTDMIGHLFGDGPGGGNDWDYAQFYLDLVAWLRAAGY